MVDDKLLLSWNNFAEKAPGPFTQLRMDQVTSATTRLHSKAVFKYTGNLNMKVLYTDVTSVPSFPNNREV